MNIRSLFVLHCYQPGNASDLIKNTRKNVISFRAETCSRIIILFSNLNNADIERIQKISERIKEKSRSCELLRGFDAYEFLLCWSVGLLNKKYNYNDRFVLGRLRDHWTAFSKSCANKLKGCDLIKIMPALLCDAHQIRGMIETSFVDLSCEERVHQTKMLCHDHRANREKTVDSHEFKFHDKIVQKIQDTQQNSTDKVIKYLTKALAEFQQQASASDDNIKLNPKKGEHQQQVTLIKARLSITAAWEKRRIQVSLLPDLDNSNITPVL